MSAFFWQKKYLHSTQWYETYVRDLLVVFSFCKIKGYCWWKCKFYRPCVRNPASRYLQIGRKLEKRQWRHSFPTWIIVKFLWRRRISLVKFSFWSKFCVNIMTGAWVMTIFVYKGFTRNPNTENTSVWVLPNTWRVGRARFTDECYKMTGLQLLTDLRY